MMILEKAPTLAVMGREGTSAGANQEVWGKCIMAAVGMEPVSAGFSLTVGRLSATVKAPNNARRNKRLFCLPRIGKSLVSYSACLAAGGLSIGWLAHIGRVTRLGLREGPAVSHWPGSVLSCLFSFKTPKQCEVLHD